MAIKGHDISEAGRETVEDGDLASAAFVHYGYADSVTERGLAINEDRIDILDTGVLPDTVVGNIIVDIIEAHIVSDLHIMEHGMVDTGRHRYTSGKLELLAEDTQFNISGEAHITNIGGVETVFDQYFAPVLGSTALGAQLLLLCISELSIVHRVE